MPMLDGKNVENLWSFSTEHRLCAVFRQFFGKKFSTFSTLLYVENLFTTFISHPPKNGNLYYFNLVIRLFTESLFYLSEVAIIKCGVKFTKNKIVVKNMIVQVIYNE